MLSCLLLLATSSLLLSGGCRHTLDPYERLNGEPQAQLVTVTDTVFPDADTYLRQSQPNSNWGADTALQLGGGGKNRVLVRFDSTALRQVVGAGTLDSAWLEFTIQAGPSGWGSNERTVDLHRLKRPWTELGATWNCAVDANTANSVADCPTQGWDMTNNGNGTYHPVRTDRVTVNNGQLGIIRLNVTADVQGYLGGTLLSQGWVFRKTGETLGGEALVFSRESGSQPRLVVSTSIVDTAPPPVPTSVSWPTNPLTVPSPANPTYNYYRNVFGILLDSTASGAQFSALLTSYGGTVIGGIGAGSVAPLYIISFPDPGPTYASMDSLAVRIRSEPGVEAVVHMSIGSDLQLRGRFPVDAGVAATRNIWFAGSSSTYPWRAVRATSAWGCENGRYGGSRPKVGVFDAFFNTLASDIDSSSTIGSDPANLGPLPPNTPAGDFDHGNAVAAIIGAKGDNGSQITGMVWGLPLVLYPAGSGQQLSQHTWLDLLNVLDHGKRNNLSILNLSLGTGDITDSTVRGHLTRYMRDFLDAAPNRLLVIASGDHSKTLALTALASTADTVLRATDRVAAELLLESSGNYRGKILFVTGTTASGARRSQSNVWTGLDTVMIAAPAVSVPSVGATGVVSNYDGTSFAAPFVAGAAAQLWTMDASLTAPQVTSYLIRGATTMRFDSTTGQLVTPSDIGAGATGVYQLDAYGALSLLSKERAGTPICGYDVRFENGAVVLAPLGSVRLPYQVFPSFTDGSVSVAQGGRRIAVSNSIYVSDPTTPRGVTVIDHLGNVIHTLANVTRRLYLERDTADIRYVQPQDTAWLTGRPLLDLWGPGRTAADRDLNVLGPFEHGVHDFFAGSWIEVSPAGDYIAALTSDRTHVTCTISGGSFAGVVDHSDLRLIPLDGSTPITTRSNTYDQCARTGNPAPNDDYLGGDQATFSHDGRRAVLAASFIDPDPLAQGNDVIRTRLYSHDLATTTASTTVVQGWYVNAPRFEADDAMLLAYDFDGFLPTAPGGGPCLAVSRRATSLGSTVGSPQSAPVSECLLVQGNVTRGNLRASRQATTPRSSLGRLVAWSGFNHVGH